MSDLHGDLITNIEPCELMLICGDISPLRIQGNHYKMRRWMTNEFLPWATKLPCNKVLFIAGNHDSIASNLEFMYTIFKKEYKVTYLFHESYTYTSKDGKEYSIFGTPYCKLFGNWAFMELDSVLEKLYSDIPENLDILMTHDAPYGTSDVILNLKYFTGEHIGNKPLAEAIYKKSPKILVHGHLHDTSREFEIIGDTKVVNCSIKDEDYKVVSNPIYYDI